MIGLALRRFGRERAAAAVAAALIGLAGCATTQTPELQVSAAPPPPAAEPTMPSPPPVDLAGKWKLTAASGGACTMTLGNAPGASQGTIAPAGGCPGSFFTSRKWTFEHDQLIVRDHKGETLAQLSFTGGHFEGQSTSGASISLSR
jgi:hypothetical protein